MLVPVNISVIAVDSLGGRSTTLAISLVLCTTCSGHGQCNRSVIRPNDELGGHFQKFACQCKAAYTDIDECVTSPCGQQCNNTVGSFQCSCYSGYQFSNVDGKTCIDINECSEQMHRCEQKCTNIPGSYNCGCEQGCTLQGDKFSCQLSVDNSVCSRSACNQLCIIDADNRLACSCKSFYTLDSQNPTVCVDINECPNVLSHNCDLSRQQICRNTQGSYTCDCQAGFSMTVGGFCQGKDVCRDESNLTCSHECTVNLDTKEAFCYCNSGYRLAGDKQTCIDIDECQDPGLNSSEQLCTNSLSSYSYACHMGFTVQPDGSCKDVDDFSTKPCKLNQQCKNRAVSYVCICPKGYTLVTNNSREWENV